MLGKLLKYEFKATARIFLPLLVLLLILTPITKLVISFDIFEGFANIIPFLTLMSYIVLIIVNCVAAFIFMIYRFYKNLLTEEGYLMFTLPVSVHSLVLSKTIVSFFWTMLCYTTSFLSIVTVLYTPEIKEEFLYAYDIASGSFYSETGIALSGLIIWSIALIVVGQIYSIFYCYCSIAIGQLTTHKIVGAIAAAVVIRIIEQVISILIFGPVLFSSGTNSDTGIGALYSIYAICGAFYIMLSAVFYFITTNILHKKLNLN